jgi:hypothetical protein
MVKISLCSARMLSLRIQAWFERSRGRLTRVVLFCGLLAVFLYLAPYVPRDTRIMLDLGERHRDVVALEMTYSLGEHDLRSTSLKYPAGAPRTVLHDVRLPAGDISLVARQILRDGRTLAETRRFQTPAEAEVRIQLNKD